MLGPSAAPAPLAPSRPSPARASPPRSLWWCCLLSSGDRLELGVPAGHPHLGRGEPWPSWEWAVVAGADPAVVLCCRGLLAESLGGAKGCPAWRSVPRECLQRDRWSSPAISQSPLPAPQASRVPQEWCWGAALVLSGISRPPRALSVCRISGSGAGCGQEGAWALMLLVSLQGASPPRV